MTKIFWIEQKLLHHFPDADLRRGIDLNKNGKIDEKERTDTNSNGKVDVEEWRAFLQRNQMDLLHLGGYMGIASIGSDYLRPDNPIHDVLSIEWDMSTQKEVLSVLTWITVMIVFLKKKLAEPASANLTPEQKLHLIFQHIRPMANKYAITTLVTEGVAKRQLDCDTLSFVVVAIAHELGWPVHIVKVPWHAFVRWDDGTHRFNMDFGQIHKDSYYIKKFNIAATSIKKGIYLRTLSRKEMLAVAYSNRANKKRDYHSALDDQQTALKLNPNSATAQANKAILLFNLKRHSEALANIRTALSLDPNSAIIHALLAKILYKRKMYNKALAEINRAIGLLRDFNDKDIFSETYELRALIHTDMGKIDDAIKDFGRVIKHDPQNGTAFFNRGSLKVKMARYAEAIPDFDAALALENKKRYSDEVVLHSLLKRGIANQKLKKVSAAFADFKAAAKHFPEREEVYNYLADAYIAVEQYDKALKSMDKAISLNPLNAVHYYNRGVIFLLAEQFAKAKEDFKAALRLDPGLVQAKHNLRALKLYPDPLFLEVGPRYRPTGGTSIDARTAIGALWRALEIGTASAIGPTLTLGQGTRGNANLLDLSAGLAFSQKRKRFSFGMRGGAGYNFAISGDQSNAPIGKGGFFEYGAYMQYLLTRSLGLGLGLTVQHEMSDPSCAALSPSIRFFFTQWD